MRVLHVMECTIGGTRRHLVDLALGQRAAGLEVDVVASTLRDPDFPPDLERLRDAGVRVHVLDMVRAPSPLLDLRHLAALKALLRERRPEVMHAHSSKAGVLGRQASLSTGIGRRIYTPHTFAFLFRALFGPAKRAVYRGLESHFAKHTDRFVAVAASEAETWAASGVVPGERVRVVPNGIDAAPFAAAEPLERGELAPGLDPHAPLIAVVGLVYAAKGQDLLLRALTEPGLERAQVVFVGPGDSQPFQGQARELGVQERIRFVGARRDVPRVLRTVDALCLPSRWEGMPYVVLEAFAAGCPVVAHPVDGARDAVVPGETGWLAEAIGPAPLAAALRSMLAADRQEVTAVTDRARACQEDHYSVDSMVAGMTRVYEEVL